MTDKKNVISPEPEINTKYWGRQNDKIRQNYFVRKIATQKVNIILIL